MDCHRIALSLSAVVFVAAAPIACGSDQSISEPPDPPDAPTVASIRIEPDTFTIEMGDTVRLSATALDAEGAVLVDQIVTWNSTDTGVATVEQGLVRGVGEGNAFIRAAAESTTGTARASIVEPRPVTLELKTDSVRLGVGEVTRLSITAHDKRGNVIAPDVAWVSSDTTIADVSQGGTIRGRREGTVLVQVSAGDLSDSARVRVEAPTKGLSSSDSARVARAFDRIAVEEEWPAAQTDTAWQAFIDPAYSSADWETFFRAYFVDRFWTANLWNWMGYPVNFWLPPDRRRALQGALLPALLDEAEWVIARHGDRLGSAMTADPALTEHVRWTHRVMWSIFHATQESEYAAMLAAGYQELILQYPEYLQKRPLDGADRMLGTVRVYAWVQLVEGQRRSGREADVAEILALTGAYREVFDRFELLLIDNFGLDTPQLDAIESFFGALPASHAKFTALTVADFWAPVGLPLGPLMLDGGANIFGTRVGAAQGQPFPDDIEPRMADTFVEVLGHEVTHKIDALHVQTSTALRERQAELIARAGRERSNYLRSMIPEGFFVENPQEFLASIGNQWFTDSEHTLRLGRLRFDRGRQEPLNQALFFAEVMSEGDDETRLYTHDQDGLTVVRVVPVERDGYGNIARIEVGDSTFAFTLDGGGNVLGYTSEAR